MSFARGWVLVMLAVPLLLGVLAVVGSRRRSGHALRFAHVELLDEIAPRHPWRRSVPGLCLAVGIGLLVASLADPYTERTVKEGTRQVVLAFDVSGSMSSDDVLPSRLDVARTAAKQFIQSSPDDVRIGLVEFAGSIVAVREPTDDRAALVRELDRIELSGGTAVGDAIVTALGLLDAQAPSRNRDTERSKPGAGSAGLIVVLSDGSTTKGTTNEQASAQAVAQGVPVSTIAFGTASGTFVEPRTGQREPVPYAPEELAAIAQATGGIAAAANDATELSKVFDDLTETVTAQRKRQDLGDGFVAAALVVLALGALLSWRWFSRLG